MTDLRYIHRIFSVLAISAPLLLSGCATTSPPTRFFLLTATASQDAGEKSPPSKRHKQGLAVELEPVEIPQYLNRPEMVTRAGGNRLRLERLNQWAGDFKEDIGRVTMENLARILASDRVMTLPGKGEAVPDFRVAITLHHFEPDETGQVVLEARWTLFDGRGKVLDTRHARLTTRAERPDDYESLASAMSLALGHLAREMGETILTQPVR
ncbi:MAG: membrane integrity-associated transporter subunit PqiC [Magnetococcales bacterium]|nr:membrane integrity-associated transporter subunit PqiC [Magnetococcales bacterium]